MVSGLMHKCGLSNSGGVVCWGPNQYGELGDGTTNNSSAPVQVVGLTSGVQAIAVGYWHSCALTDAGGVVCWGMNGLGALGDGTTTSFSSVPVPVVGLNSGVKAIAAGFYHTCALTNAGAIYCWGENGHGELGIGTSDYAAHSTPTPVSGLGSNGIKSITAAARGHVCAVTNPGGVICWGANDWGQLGNNTRTYSYLPVQVAGLTSGIQQVIVGVDSSCAVSDLGAVQCWGFLPLQFRYSTIPVPFPELASGIKNIGLGDGDDNGCALTILGTVLCWGINLHGEVGNGTMSSYVVTTPVQTLGLRNNVTSLDVSQAFDACALLNQGTVKCWGGSIPTPYLVLNTDGVTPLNLGVTQTVKPINNDFNADVKSDLLWRNADGRNTVWLMNGSSVQTTASLLSLSTDFSLANVGDFDGDGKTDILWRNTAGNNLVWLMNGSAIQTATFLPAVSTDWSIAKVADFNGDGNADILWRSTDGRNALWLMNGSTIQTAVFLPAIPAEWVLSKVADFDGDGKADILWRNADGRNALWLMNGTTIQTAVFLPAIPAEWVLAKVADFDGDGKADIWWRNADGRNAVWLMNGSTIQTAAFLPAVPSEWVLAKVADFNGDGKADIWWRNTDGRNAVWLMNGTSVQSGVFVSTMTSDWTLVDP